MIYRFILALFVLFALFLDGRVFANVWLFQPGQSVRSIQDDFRFGPQVYRGIGKLNRGLANQQVLSFLGKHKAELGIDRVDGETLEMRRLHGTGTGFSLRYIQRFNRVTIEGAEIIAIFDAQGTLRSLNSSLMPTPPITVQPTVTREAAYQIATHMLRYAEPEQGNGFNDGLLIISTQGHAALVWQFSIREYRTGERPMVVQVGASGPFAGKMLKTISAAHEDGSRGGIINIYDASVAVVIPSPVFKGVRVLADGHETLAGRVLVSDAAKNANRNLEFARTFFANSFNRWSYDGQGSEINAAVNTLRIGFFDVLGQKENAAWIGPWKMFTFGAGSDRLGGFESELDIVAHEFTHAVIGSTSNLAYEGQSGALNESLADVFGATIRHQFAATATPFLIGDAVLKGEFQKRATALRNMLDPRQGLVPQPGTMAEMGNTSGCKPTPNNDNCGVHVFSGIPNRAFALTVQAIGWEAAAPLFYRVMTGRLRSKSQFSDYRNQVLAECFDTLGQARCEGVKGAFAQVGL